MRKQSLFKVLHAEKEPNQRSLFWFNKPKATKVSFLVLVAWTIALIYLYDGIYFTHGIWAIFLHMISSLMVSYVTLGIYLYAGIFVSNRLSGKFVSYKKTRDEATYAILITPIRAAIIVGVVSWIGGIIVTGGQRIF